MADKIASLLVEIPKGRREGQVGWLVLEADAGAEGWFVFHHRDLSEACEFDDWHLTREAAIAAVRERFGIAESDWKPRPPL